MKFTKFELSLLLQIKKIVKEKNFKYIRISKKHITYRDTNGEKYFFENNKFVSVLNLENAVLNLVESDNESANEDVDVPVLDDFARLEDEDSIVEDENSIVEDENSIVEDENSIVEDENSIVEDEDSIVEDEDSIVNLNESALGINDKNVNVDVDDFARLEDENSIVNENAVLYLKKRARLVGEDSIVNEIAVLNLKKRARLEEVDVPKSFKPYLSQIAKYKNSNLIENDSSGVNSNKESTVNGNGYINEVLNGNATIDFNFNIFEEYEKSPSNNFDNALIQTNEVSPLIQTNEVSPSNNSLVLMNDFNFNIFEEYEKSPSNNFDNALIQTNEVSPLIQTNEVSPSNNSLVLMNDFNFNIFEESEESPSIPIEINQISYFDYYRRVVNQEITFNQLTCFDYNQQEINNLQVSSNASENNLELTKEALKKEILSLEKIHRLDNENLQYKDETNFSNVIENCLVDEKKTEIQNCDLLKRYFKAGALLDKLYHTVKEIVKQVSHKSLVTGVIKGVGITDICKRYDGNYGYNESQRAKILYYKSMRVYKVYKSFPHPSSQIDRAVTITANQLYKFANNEDFEKFVEEIELEVTRNYDNYKCGDDQEVIDYSFITQDIIENVKFFAKHPNEIEVY